VGRGGGRSHGFEPMEKITDGDHATLFFLLLLFNAKTYRFWSFDENFGLSHFVLPFLKVHMSKTDGWLWKYMVHIYTHF
jgi:hypothetical protein